MNPRLSGKFTGRASPPWRCRRISAGASGTCAEWHAACTKRLPGLGHAVLMPPEDNRMTRGADHSRHRFVPRGCAARQRESTLSPERRRSGGIQLGEAPSFTGPPLYPGCPRRSFIRSETKFVSASAHRQVRSRDGNIHGAVMALQPFWSRVGITRRRVAESGCGTSCLSSQSRSGPLSVTGASEGAHASVDGRRNGPSQAARRPRQ